MLKRGKSRSRSRSPPLKIAGLTKRIRYGSSMGKREESKDYRLIFSAYGLDDFKVFWVDFPCQSLSSFRKGTYNPDCHDSQKLSCIPDFVGATDWEVYVKPVVVGSIVYALAQKTLSFDVFKKLQIITLDLNSPVKQWEILPSLPRFEIKTTDYCQLVSLRGLLFVLRAYPCFGAFFNPKTRKWSKLKQPMPDGVSVHSSNVLFFASMGDSLGKILVYRIDHDSKTWILLYDVASNTWDNSVIPGEPLHGGRMSFHRILYSPVMVEDNGCHTLYFMDNCGVVFGFDYDAMKLSSGKLSGCMDGGFKYMIHECHQGTLFLHFEGDLFCLCCPTHQLTGDRHYVDGVFDDDDDNDNRTFTFVYRSCFHFIFIRVIKADDNNSLEAFVVGCLEHTVDGEYSPFGASFV